MNWWTRLLTALVRHEVVAVPPDRLFSSRPLDSVTSRAVLGTGQACAVVDGGIVQAVCRADDGPSLLGRVRRQRSSWREPVLLTWSSRPISIRVVIPSIVSKDRHGFTVIADLRVRLERDCEPGSPAPASPESAGSIEDMLRAPLTAALYPLACDVEGGTLLDEWPADPALASRCLDAARLALVGVALVEGLPLLRAANTFFEARREQQRQQRHDLASLDALEEQSLIRGAVRLLAHQERIDCLQKESEYAAAEAMLQNDVELRRKAISQELERADVDAAIAKVGHARRQAEAVSDMVDAASRMQSKLFESAAQLAAHLSAEFDGRAGGAAFSAHERSQVQSLLAASARTARSPQEVLAALQAGLPLPVSLFSPFRKLEGTHAVKVGTQWKAFDGDTLWTLYVTRITTRRHGWLWLSESPAIVAVKASGRPGGRELEWSIESDETTVEIGDSEVRGRLVPGRAGAAVHLIAATSRGHQRH